MTVCPYVLVLISEAVRNVLKPTQNDGQTLNGVDPLYLIYQIALCAFRFPTLYRTTVLLAFTLSLARSESLNPGPIT